MIRQRIIFPNPPKGLLPVYTFEREEFTWREGYGGYLVCSRALVCPHCLVTWAILPVDGQPICRLEPVSCTKCNVTEIDFRFAHLRSRIPGSLIDYSLANGIDWGLLDVMPETLLRRECELTLRAFSCQS